MPFFVMPIVGWVLILVALKQFSDMTKKESIFRDFLISVIIAFFMWVVFLVIWCGEWILLAINRGSEFFQFFLPFLSVLFLGRLMGIASAYFARRSLTTLSEITGEKLFAQAGSFLFLGALLIIILVGIVISLVGQIFEAIAFFSLPDNLPFEASI